MDLKNVVTIERYNVDPIKIPEVSDTPGPGSYNVENDPRVIVKPQTLAPLTALPEQPGPLKFYEAHVLLGSHITTYHLFATEILVPGLHFYDISKAESFGRKSAVTHGAPAHPSTHLPNTETADP